MLGDDRRIAARLAENQSGVPMFLDIKDAEYPTADIAFESMGRAMPSGVRREFQFHQIVILVAMLTMTFVVFHGSLPLGGDLI